MTWGSAHVNAAPLASYFVGSFPRLDIVINNACQTVRRPPAYYQHLIDTEISGVIADEVGAGFTGAGSSAGTNTGTSCGTGIGVDGAPSSLRAKVDQVVHSFLLWHEQRRDAH